MSEQSPPDKRLIALVSGAKIKPIIKAPVDYPTVAWLLHNTRWTYWAGKGRAYCYNTRPLPTRIGMGRKHWAAWKCRVNYADNYWFPIGKPMFFARRKAASKKAYEWFQKQQNARKDRETLKLLRQKKQEAASYTTNLGG